MTELPSGWTSVSLADLIANDGVFTDGDWVESKDQDPDGEVRLVQLADIGVGVFRDRSDRRLTAEKAKELRCTFLEPGDVLIARMPKPLGRACLFPAHQDQSVTVVDVAVLRPGTSSVNPTWLKWAINAPQFGRQIEDLASGTTRQRISRKNLASLSVPLPPLAEQRRIVDAIEEHFTRIDAAVAALEVCSLRAKSLRRSTVACAFSGDWPKLRLRDIADVHLGRQRSPKNHVGPHMRPYLRAANVTWEGLNLSDVKEMNFNPTEAKRFALQPGDLLLAEASGSASEVGKPVIWRGEIPGACFQNTLLRVQSHGPLPEYLLHYFRQLATSGAFARGSRGVGIHHLGKLGMEQYEIPVPPIQEQVRIVAMIEESLARIDVAEQALIVGLRKLNALRRSILVAAFTGRLVSQDSSDEPANALLERVRSEMQSAQSTRKGRTKVAS